MQPITDEIIQEIKDRIVKGVRPEKIILFGSYAYGTPTKDSDLDLFYRNTPQLAAVGYSRLEEQQQTSRHEIPHSLLWGASLVILPTEEPMHRRVTRIRKLLRDINIPKDVIVYTPQEVEKWKNASAAFITSIIKKGKVIYG